MAIKPSDDEIRKIKRNGRRQLKRKVESQQAQGKDFVLPDHSAGVIPEKRWQEIKGDK